MGTRECVASVNIDVSGEQQQHPQTMEKGNVHNREISEYEMSREERIKENQERMQKLGIVDLSLKLRTLQRTPNSVSRRKVFRGQDRTPPPQPGAVRRSSRLQNSTPVSYCEVNVARKDESLDDGVLLREEGSKPEIYTVEHEKLLGSTEMSWTFFVDGYGKDGKRIYDPVRGKTCHQCRQKTLGFRTHCKECNMVQGQFCGDCLYMRYGENVLEAKENPNWICPVCRGICNCSLCRQAKGWPPTGPLYRKISSLGFKSVAHYLIQTRQADAKSDNNVGTKVPISSKRSLPFSEIEVPSGEEDLFKSNLECVHADPPIEVNTECDNTKVAPETCEGLSLNPPVTTLSNDQLGCISSPGIEQIDSENEKEKETNVALHTVLDESGRETKTPAEPLSIPKALEGAGERNEIKKEETTETCEKLSLKPPVTTLSKDHLGCLSNPGTEQIDSEKEKETNIAVHTELDEGETEIKEGEITVLGNSDLAMQETSTKSVKKRVRSEPTPDSIAGRLRQRRRKSNNSDDLQSANANPSTY